MRHTRFISRRESLDGPLFNVDSFTLKSIWSIIQEIVKDMKERNEIYSGLKKYFKLYKCEDKILCIQYSRYNFYFQVSSSIDFPEAATTVRIATKC